MKPMLSATIESVSKLKFPLLASPKLDGIRALVVNGVLVSRNLKPIPNHFVQRSLPLARMEGWDGELIVGKPDDKDCFRKTTSGVMSEEGEPKFKFWVFDNMIPELKFSDRFKGLQVNIKNLYCGHVRLVPQFKVVDAFALHQYEELMLERGYEGIMLRRIDGGYKYGRSTLKEGHLMKLKQFKDAEAVIVGMEEQMENTNEKKLNELGKLQRSSHKAGKVGKNTLGALKVQDIITGVSFDVGTGFDDETRLDLWMNKSKYIGKLIKYKYFPTGSKDKPRFPVFMGFRED